MRLASFVAARLAGVLEALPVEKQGVFHVLREISPAVVAGAQVELVREAPLRKDSIEQLRALFKAVTVVVATIKVELQVGKPLGMLGQCQRVVGVEISLVERGS